MRTPSPWVAPAVAKIPLTLFFPPTSEPLDATVIRLLLPRYLRTLSPIPDNTNQFAYSGVLKNRDAIPPNVKISIWGPYYYI